MGFLKETLSRVSSETPLYFKRIGRMGMGLTASGFAMLSTGTLPATVHIPAMVGNIGGHMLVAGLIASAVAKLPCQDPDDPKK